MPGKLIILTGASGSGKTTITDMLKGMKTTSPLMFVHFDSKGVPNLDVMIKDFGSPEEWQKVQTSNWMKQICSEYLSTFDVIFEGQMRIAFIQKALEEVGLHLKENLVKIILLDCNDTERQKRLIHDRQQPELAHQEMLNWAKFLREEATAKGIPIIDTSLLLVNQCAKVVFDELFP